MVDAQRKAGLGALGALVLLAVVLVAANTLAGRFLAGVRIDLTENKLFTLSEGTLAVLDDIDEPVNLYFFYSADAAREIPQIHNHGRRVRDVLEEFTAASDGKLRLSVIDPEPFSDDEDRAVELGVQPVPFNDGTRNLYFGLAGSNTVGDTEVIAYFQVNRAGLLEYELAKLVYQLANPEKPVVGLLTPLPVAGDFDPQTRRPIPAWYVQQRVEEFFQVETVDPDVDEIPEQVDVLMVVHPVGLEEATLYAIDQYVMGGGRLLLFIDPYSEAAVMGRRLGPRSDLEPLLSAWGVQFDAEHAVGDAGIAIAIAMERNKPPVYHLSLLGMEGDLINQEDVVTRGLTTINMGHVGALSVADDAALEMSPLLSSTAQAAPLDVNLLMGLTDPGTLQQGFEPTQETYTVAARLNGNLSSAYPDGAPEGATAANGHLVNTAEPANIIVVADTDLLTDRFWVQVQNLLGQRIAIPFASNGDLVINALDNLLGSNALINIRSRADHVRAFDRVIELRRVADGKFRVKERELQQALSDTESKLNQLQSQESETGALVLSDEQRQTLIQYQEDKLRIRKQLRDVRHQLDKDISALGTRLKFINILLVPLLLTLVAVLVTVLKRRRHRSGASHA